MRIAYVADRIRSRNELLPGPIDLEWIEAFDGEIFVFTDEDGPAADVLRSRSIPVSIAPKRFMEDGTGRPISSDHVQALSLYQEHTRSPFDFILYDSARPIDMAWFVPALADVPRMVALGAGAPADAAVVGHSSSLGARVGRSLWTSASSVLNADGLLSRIPPEELGLGRFERLIFAPTTEAASPFIAPEHPVDLVVVVAEHGDIIERSKILPTIFAQPFVDQSSTVAVVSTDIQVGADTVAQALLATCSVAQREATIVVPPGDDAIAFGFLQQADVVVAATTADLAVPAVWDVAVSKGVMVFESFEPVVRQLAIPNPRRKNAMLVPVADNMAGVLVGDGDEDTVIFHTSSGTQLAARLASMISSCSDLTVISGANPVTGAPDTSRFSPDVLAVRRALLDVFLPRLEQAGSLWEAIVWSMGLSHAEQCSLEALAGPPDLTFYDQPNLNVPGLRVIIGGHPALKRLNLAEVQPLSTSEPGGPGAREWAEGQRWADRMRLALPWKFGLIDKAMKDRW